MAEFNETSYKIMEVALKLFSEQGYYATTTKQIAQAAEVNELTIFRHFGSKSNLFQVTTEEYVINANIEKVLLDGLQALEIEQVIQVIARRIYDLYIQNTKLYKVQLKLSDNEVEFVKLKLSRKIKNILQDYFEQLTSLKVLAGNAEIMALTLINSLLGQFTIEIIAEDFFEGNQQDTLIKEYAKQFISLYKC